MQSYGIAGHAFDAVAPARLAEHATELRGSDGPPAVVSDDFDASAWPSRAISQVRFFQGNVSDYEAFRHKELGRSADQPHRIRYKRLAAA
jgi:hypothetical protein